jgi:hypothetical protein
MEIPQTVEEANRQGYVTEQKTLEEAKKIMESGAIAGIESKGAHKDCSTIPPNHKCWEGDCDASGWKEVLYCDGVQGCTIYARVRCQP